MITRYQRQEVAPKTDFFENRFGILSSQGFQKNIYINLAVKILSGNPQEVTVKDRGYVK